MKDSIVTFIIPSMNRPRSLEGLNHALESLRRQTDDRWKAIVCFDHCEPTVSPDEKVSVYTYEGYSKKDEDCPLCKEGVRSGAGPVRNYAISKASTDWVAFLDDDDVVTRDYVENLSKEISEKNCDAVVFRMWRTLTKDHVNSDVSHSKPGQKEFGRFLPRPGHKAESFRPGNLGISFAVKRNLFEKYKFPRGRGEDYALMNYLRNDGIKIVFSKKITYFVRFKNTDEDVISKIKIEVEKRLKKIK